MATKNFFDLLGDDENEDPSQVVVRANSIPVEEKKPAADKKKPAEPAKLPTKPAPPSEAGMLLSVVDIVCAFSRLDSTSVKHRDVLERKAPPL